MGNKRNTEFIRVIKDKNYTVLNNEFLKRDDLSWKAKGILAYILSLPDDWKIHTSELVKHATDGRDSFRSGWKELVEAGYIERYPVKDKDTQRITKWETKVYESIGLKASSPQTDKPQVEKPLMDKPQVENPKLLSTKSTKYSKELNTDIKDHSPAEAEPDVPYKEIVDHLNGKADRNFRHTTGKTKSLIKARWNEDFQLDDFKKVIDVKVGEWQNDSDMNKFLRPQTLFGTKFESYLNQPMNNKQERDWESWDFMD